MKPNEFDNYLALLSRFLRVSATQRDALGDELRDHLESRIAELVAAGTAEAEAEQQALAEFGDAASLAQQFQSVFQTYRRRWMMRFTTFAIAGSFLVLLLAFSLWPEGARFGAPSYSLSQDDIAARATDRTEPSSTSQRNERTKKILTEKATLDYNEVPFGQVMKEITDKYAINVLLDQSARDDLLTADQPIIFGVKDLELGIALRMLLREHNATFIVREGIVMVISLDVARDADYFERRIVDVRRLLERIDGNDPHSESWSEDSELSLTHLITKAVAPSYWEENGGEGTLGIVGGLLVVYNTEAVNDQVETLIHDLEYRMQRSAVVHRPEASAFGVYTEPGPRVSGSIPSPPTSPGAAK